MFGQVFCDEPEAVEHGKNARSVNRIWTRKRREELINGKK